MAEREDIELCGKAWR